MPHVPLVVSDGVHKHKDAIRVLITGFGPFARYEVNPSWLAVKPLHNVLLESSSPVEPVTIENQEVLLSDVDISRPVHITVLKVPVTYGAVLSIIPELHARPTKLPALDEDDKELSGFPLGPDPPEDGYDFVLHVGAGQRGNMRVEKLAHKLGYDMPDVERKFAPIVSGKTGERDEERRRGGSDDDAEVFERARLALGLQDSAVRGFAEGYESFAEELETDIDVDALVQELKESGVDQVQANTNPGRYLCDFIYYCSLAESQRTRTKGVGKKTKVLFVHCPPVGEPLDTEYVTEALRRIVASACSQIS